MKTWTSKNYFYCSHSWDSFQTLWWLDSTFQQDQNKHQQTSLLNLRYCPPEIQSCKSLHKYTLFTEAKKPQGSSPQTKQVRENQTQQRYLGMRACDKPESEKKVEHHQKLEYTAQQGSWKTVNSEKQLGFLSSDLMLFLSKAFWRLF